MTRLFAAFGILAASCLPAATLAQSGEGKRISSVVFDHIDRAGTGFIDQGQFMIAGQDVFAAMEYDGDNKVSLGEFLGYDIGMKPVAAAAGREAELETGLRVVFAFWDRNGDGFLTTSEHQRALAMDFQRADDNSDARLSADEFLDGFTVMVAARAAINPAPVN